MKDENGKPWRKENVTRVYYSLAVWRFKPILSAGLRFHSHLSGGLRLRNHRAVAGNHKFSSRFSVFACFCGGYSNRVKRLRRLSGNFILLKASLFNKGLPFRARPSQSGLPSVSPAISIGPFPRAWSTFPASRDPKLTPKALGFRSDPPKQNLDGLA